MKWISPNLMDYRTLYNQKQDLLKALHCNYLISDRATYLPHEPKSSHLLFNNPVTSPLPFI